jgi:uroporphyrinogen-III decarboxylase
MEWRGFDLRPRREKIERAFKCLPVRSAEDVPVLVHTPCYFAFGGRHVPADYFTNPASMLKFQADGYQKHLEQVHDDVIPYFMPWFGTGVLASAFGCEVREPTTSGADPSVVSHCVQSVADIARLRLPDFYKDGWMPRVLSAIDYARANGDLPVGLTDMNSVFSTVCQMCGYEKLFIWMYEEPKAIHDLFTLVTNAFIEWVKIQKQHIGEPLDRSNGLQGVWSPQGVGVWMSDDDLVFTSPDLYDKFVRPHVARAFETFGGGSLHFCGKGVHQLPNLLQIKNLRAINNSPMGDFASFAKLHQGLNGKVTVQIQDYTPVHIEPYYQRLFDSIDDLRGVMLASFCIDSIGMDDKGGACTVERDNFAAANQVVKVIRECVRKKLATRQ